MQLASPKFTHLFPHSFPLCGFRCIPWKLRHNYLRPMLRGLVRRPCLARPLGMVILGFAIRIRVLMIFFLAAIHFSPRLSGKERIGERSLPPCSIGRLDLYGLVNYLLTLSSPWIFFTTVYYQDRIIQALPHPHLPVG